MSINLQKSQTILTLNLDYLLRVTALSSSNVYMGRFLNSGIDLFIVKISIIYYA